ncbi:serine/threonine-protein kinase [Microbispora sp. ATCC PTA-5024]|uniref:serine/threonine-protein kinase n=1 Tax=Microbispora sp. ATCC PTA-5024 TaxID=316330 RepID=UPI0004263CB6|nr:serine/threonine-protein kinase [Microbispora sp. ATCC PTA-5024]
MDEGRRVAGRYHLLEPIGRGGMGVVWRAHDDLLDRAVAVKEVLYHPTSEEDREAFTRRTIREARAAGRITHPNVVVVHDVIEEDGRPWIVMQLVRARSLGQVLREHGPLVPERVASIGLQVLDALCTAHAAGVLHRDVKPENVLLSGDNRVVLTDFGIATMPEETGFTMTGAITGTPAFLPPERLNGLPATPESDLWSLGATLYAAVEGRPPFDRNSPIATMAAVLHDEPEPPLRAGPLTPVLDGLLRKDPDRRMDAVEVSELLEAVIAGRGRDVPDPRSAWERAASGPHDRTDRAPAANGRTARETPERRDTRGQAVAAGRPYGPTDRSPHGHGAATTHSGPRRGDTYADGAPLPPGGRGGRVERPRRRTPLLLLVLIPVLVAAAGLGGWYGYRTLASGSSGGSSGSPSTSAGPSQEPGTPTPTPSPSPTLPDGWTTHDDSLGFTIALPGDWTEFGREATRVRFHAPTGRDYLQVDVTPWTDEDPVAALATVEKTSTGKGYLPGYERIRLDSRRYLGVPAADWEFTYRPSYGRVRVVDRAFKLPDGRCFTLYWQVADARWTSGLSYFQRFTSTFQPR